MVGVEGPSSSYPKVPIGEDKKCCWVCRASGLSLSLLSQSDANHRFRINPTQTDYYKPLDMKETLWKNKSPKIWTLETGEELAWTCFDCAH